MYNTPIKKRLQGKGKSTMINSLSSQYKKAGVDIQAGEKLVEWLKDTSHQVDSSQCRWLEKHLLSGIGGFASIFKLPSGYKNPCLVSCTDGVGTKLLLGIQAGKLQGLGEDLVAMCVNDLIVQGARPLFFLDYFACGQLDLKTTKDFLLGVQSACKQAGCLLVGGETAEMPGFYLKGHFDCAGFAVGVVEEDQIITGQDMQPGDFVLGIESSGFHSNGYSLLRKIFHNEPKYLQELLIPTRIYVEPILKLLDKQIKIHGMAHITGGGMDNIQRVLQKGISFTIDQWTWPSIYKEIQQRTGMTTTELLKTFNCGIGYVLIVPPSSVDALKKELTLYDWTVQHLGVLQSSNQLDSCSLNYHLDEKIEMQ